MAAAMEATSDWFGPIPGVFMYRVYVCSAAVG